MAALAITVLVALIGAVGAGFVAFRSMPKLGSNPRGRIARRAVALLCALAGAEIATQLVELVHQLELDAETASVFKGAGGAYDAFDFASAFREILFSGGLLIGLAALVAVAATRRYGRAPG